MFDYILNNLENVIYLLTINNINHLFNIKNVYFAGKSNHVMLKNCGKFKSIHDIKKRRQYSTHEEYYKSIEVNFIEKYIRRYDRFINILNNSSNKLLFIFSSENIIVNNDDINKIKEIIKILIDRYNLLDFKIVWFNFNLIDTDNNEFFYKKILDHFYILKCKREKRSVPEFNKLLFEKLIKIYNI